MKRENADLASQSPTPSPKAKPMKGLWKRLLSSAVLISITCATIFLAPRWMLFVVVTLFAVTGFYEYLRLLEKKGYSDNWMLPLFLSLFIPFAVLYSYEYFTFALIALILFLFHFKRETQNQAFACSALTVFGMVYIVWFMSYLIKIRYLEDGAFWVFYAILLAKAGDAGAYFVGTRFGKMKLIEHISPNKSVEGAWGGFFTTVVLSLVCAVFYLKVSWLHFLGMGVFIGVVSQLGDLVESLIKREVGIKDSGTIPGLGGILDVLDSLIFVMPFLYFYLHQMVKIPLDI